MGAGQIGGIATLLDIDFENAAGFLGEKASPTEGQFIVYYFSQAMMFCVGGLIEAHIVLTPAMCVYGERNKFEVFGGTHSFVENSGVSRIVHHISMHRGYNHTKRFVECLTDNLALLVLNKQYHFNHRELGSEFILNRLRYGPPEAPLDEITKKKPLICKFFGWGSRRNGYLIPLLVHQKGMEVKLLPKEMCPAMWNKDNKYLCIEQPPCKSAEFGALCPDDVGSVLVCSGFARGMMISSLVDRPCGVGFVDLSMYVKFLTCGVDDSRDVINHDEFMTFEFTTIRTPATPSLIVPPIIVEHDDDDDDSHKKDNHKHTNHDNKHDDNKNNDNKTNDTKNANNHNSDKATF